MAQPNYINIGTTPNDGQGDPIRTSFGLSNDWFSYLGNRAQTLPPSTLTGSVGDQAGWYAYDSNYFYYCFANYTGNSTIWAQIAQIGNISVSSINNGNSNVAVNGLAGNVTVSVNGTSNVAVFGTGGIFLNGVVSAAGNVRGGNLNTAGQVSASGNIIGNYIIGNGSQLTGLPASYSNANVAAYLPTYSGNIGSGNLLTTGMVSAAGNITTNNISASSTISATGNIITAGYFVGNFAGNITGNLVIPGSNTQVIFNTNGNSDAVAGMTYNKGTNTFVVLGTVSSQGNTIGGNIVTAGLITAAGNIYAGNLINSGASSVSGNITGGNILTSGLVSVAGGLNTSTTIVAQGNIRGGNLISNGLITASGNVTGGNILTAGQVSATGNISGAYFSASNDINAGGNVSAINYTGTSVSVIANITGGNLNISSGNISTGNATGYLFDTVTSNIRIGTFNAEYVTIGTAGSQTIIQGNAAVTANIGTNLKGAMLIDADYVYTPTNQQGVMLQVQGQTNLPTRVYIDSGGANNYSAIIGRHYNGNTSSPAQVLANSVVARYGATPYTSNGWPTISTTRIDMVTLQDQTLTALGSQIQFWTTPNNTIGIVKVATVDDTGISVAGNVTAAYLKTSATTINSNITTTGLISATGNITGGNLTTGLVSATGVFAANIGNIGTNLTGSILTVGNIVNANGNAVGNIGNSSNYFNTVFAKATLAQYADLAEKYTADTDYAPGTVLSFGGLAEVTVADTDADPLVAGVVSTNPAYCMNSGLTGDHVVTVALVGRVPCQVQGLVARGAMMVSAGNGRARAESNPAMGTVIGKALEAFDGDIGTIEIVVGKL